MYLIFYFDSFKTNLAKQLIVVFFVYLKMFFLLLLKTVKNKISDSKTK